MVKMRVSRLRILRIDFYKTINSLYPSFMNDMFKVNMFQRLPRAKYKLNLDIPKWHQITFGAKSLKVYGSKIWNTVIPYKKLFKKVFKSIIKNWETIKICFLARYFQRSKNIL